jgi:hypothetical protein
MDGLRRGMYVYGKQRVPVVKESACQGGLEETTLKS